MRKILYIESGKHKFNTSDPGVESITSGDNPLRFFIEHKDGTQHVLFPSETFLVKLSEETPDIVVPEIVLDGQTS